MRAAAARRTKHPGGGGGGGRAAAAPRESRGFCVARHKVQGSGAIARRARRCPPLSALRRRPWDSRVHHGGALSPLSTGEEIKKGKSEFAHPPLWDAKWRFAYANVCIKNCTFPIMGVYSHSRSHTPAGRPPLPATASRSCHRPRRRQLPHAQDVGHTLGLCTKKAPHTLGLCTSGGPAGGAGCGP